MDQKLRRLSDSVTSLTDKLTTIHSLAIDLNVSTQITKNLYDAKCSLAETKILIDIQLLQDSSGVVSTDIERKNITTPDEVIPIKKNDTNNALEFSALIKCEEEEKNDNLIETLENAGDVSFVDLSATVVLETKIEIDEFSEDIKSFELEEPRTRKKSPKLKSKPKIKSEDALDKENNDEPITKTVSMNKHKKDTVSNITETLMDDKHLNNKKKVNFKNKAEKGIKKKCWNCFKKILEEDFSAHKDSCKPTKAQCSECGKILSNKKKLNDHMIIHTHPNKQFSCDICDKKYRTDKDLFKHKKSSHIDLRTCDICGASIRGGKGALKDHIKTHEENRERPHSCHKCGKSFYKPQLLKTHLESHTEQKLFSCESCGKSFSRRALLKQHEMVHSDIVPFSCSICSKTYKYRSTLQKHMRSHNS